LSKPLIYKTLSSKIEGRIGYINIDTRFYFQALKNCSRIFDVPLRGKHSMQAKWLSCKGLYIRKHNNVNTIVSTIVRTTVTTTANTTIA